MQTDRSLDARERRPRDPGQVRAAVPVAARRPLKLGPIISPLVAMVLAAVSVFPVIYMFSASLMQPSQIFSVPLQLIPNPPRPANFVDIFSQFNIGHYLFNSVLVAVCVVILNLFFCSLTGYSLAKFRYPGRSIVFGFILSTMMIPFNVILVPLYVVIRNRV